MKFGFANCRSIRNKGPTLCEEAETGNLKGKNRTVIAKLMNYKDKVNILKVRQQLKSSENISISDDYPPDVEKERTQLYPVMKAIKEKMYGEDRSKVGLKENQLILRGKAYGVNDLHILPSEFDAHNLFTPTHNNITAFYTRNSVLSNHYVCEFRVDGQ